MGPYCLWCKKEATQRCQCCNVATYCCRKCQKKDYAIHQAEAPTQEPLEMGANDGGGGAMEVEPRGRVRIPTEPRVARGSLLPDYVEELRSVIEVRLARIETMMDPAMRREFLAKHHSPETILMATTRDMSEQYPAVRAALDELFEVEHRDTEERMYSYHRLEEARIRAYAQKNGLLLHWTDYSNVVRLRELAAYQLAVGAGEDIHGVTNLCKAGLANGDRANRLLTEFLLRPTLNLFETNLYGKYQRALLEKEKQTDRVKQYVEDLFPFYWQRVESDVVAMVRAAYEEKRESVGKRESGRGEGEERRTRRRLQQLGVRQARVVVAPVPVVESEEEEEEEEWAEAEDVYTELMERVEEFQGAPQTLVNEINRVRTGNLNEKIKAMIEVHGKNLTEEQEQELVERVILDASIVMTTLKNYAISDPTLEESVASNLKEMLDAWQQKTLESMRESVSDQESWMWRQFRNMRNWIYERRIRISAFALFATLIVGTSYFMLRAREKYASVYTSEEENRAALSQMNKIKTDVKIGQQQTQAEIKKQNDQFVNNIATKSRISSDESIRKHAEEQFMVLHRDTVTFEQMNGACDEGIALFRGKEFGEPFVTHYTTGKQLIADLELFTSNPERTLSEKAEAVNNVLAWWNTGDRFIEDSWKYKNLLTRYANLQEVETSVRRQVRQLLANLEDSNAALAGATETLGVVGKKFDKILGDLGRTEAHVEEADRITRAYGQNRPFARALVEWLGEEYRKFLSPNYVLPDMNMLAAKDAKDVALYTAVLSLSSLDVAMSGAANLLHTYQTVGVTWKGLGTCFKWFTDWGNLGAMRTIMIVLSLSTDIVRLNALVPFRTKLQELLALFQYDIVKPIPLEDAYFLAAILRERPELSEEKRELYVRLREEAILGRSYTPDLYHTKFLDSLDRDLIDEEEWDFLERIADEMSTDARFRYLRASYRYYMGDWSNSATMVLLGEDGCGGRRQDDGVYHGYDGEDTELLQHHPETGRCWPDPGQ
jgi:hypothetical protein